MGTKLEEVHFFRLTFAGHAARESFHRIGRSEVFVPFDQIFKVQTNAAAFASGLQLGPAPVERPQAGLGCEHLLATTDGWSEHSFFK